MTQEVTLVTRTPPSGPLCLWQCFIMDMVAQMQGGKRANSKKCMQMISTERNHSDFSQHNCWKNIPWTLNLLFLYQFHAQKALFKVPKICNINFWIENAPPFPLSNFSTNSSEFVVGPFPKYPSPQCPLELQSAGLGCTSLAELEEENVLNLPTNQFL